MTVATSSIERTVPFSQPDCVALGVVNFVDVTSVHNVNGASACFGKGMIVTVTASKAVHHATLNGSTAHKSVTVFKLYVDGEPIIVPDPDGSSSYQATVPVSPSNTVVLCVVIFVAISSIHKLNGASAGVGNGWMVTVTSTEAVQTVRVKVTTDHKFVRVFHW